jgi:hypothetical protein
MSTVSDHELFLALAEEKHFNERRRFEERQREARKEQEAKRREQLRQEIERIRWRA